MSVIAPASTQLWMSRPEQATRWAREMLEPGRALIVGTGRHDDITLLNTAGHPLLDEQCTTSALRQLVAHTAGPVRILAYEQLIASETITRLATHHHVNLAHVEETEIWGCISRAWSVWLGHPNHSHPLQAGQDSFARADAALTVLRQIATNHLEGAPHG